MARRLLSCIATVGLVACSGGADTNSLGGSGGTSGGASYSSNFGETSSVGGGGVAIVPGKSTATVNTGAGSTTGGATTDGTATGDTTTTTLPDGGVGTTTVKALKTVNYGEALRTATLKLTGVLPTLADIKSLAAATTAADQKVVYEKLVDQALASTAFADTQLTFWKNTFKTGGAAAAGGPDLNAAATFAASVVVGDRPYTDILTASTGTCPTYANGAFTAANCPAGAPTAGVLSDPGLMSQYFSNMAFRRVRFVQEVFACSPMPAEFSATPVKMGSGEYTSPWDFDSIAGGTTAKVNFQDTSAVICANCHTTMNHIAPLFANFDAKGAYAAGKIAVQTPVVPPVTTTLVDWLPAGQSLAWRNGVTVTDLPSLGAAMAKDNDIARCAVTRVWDWAFSRGDVVNDSAPVPATVTDPYLATFKTNGMKVKALIRSVLTSDDFVQY